MWSFPDTVDFNCVVSIWRLLSMLPRRFSWRKSYYVTAVHTHILTHYSFVAALLTPLVRFPSKNRRGARRELVDERYDVSASTCRTTKRWVPAVLVGRSPHGRSKITTCSSLRGCWCDTGYVVYNSLRCNERHVVFALLWISPYFIRKFWKGVHWALSCEHSTRIYEKEYIYCSFLFHINSF